MIFLRRFFLYFIPAILLFYGGDKMDNFFGKDLPKHNQVYEIACYLFGLVIINVIVPISTEKTKKKITEQDVLIGVLLKDLRDSLNEELEREMNTEHLGLNIRIFYPKRSPRLWALKKINGQRVLFLHEHANLCVDSVGKLSFRVFPKIEGLVGKAFNEKCMVYDNNLNSQRSKSEYNLNPHQNSVTADTKFVIAAPIFKDGTDDKISAIVSFDSKKSVTLPQNKEWESAIRDSCKILHKCIPFICTKR